jgi:hypothetical protein
MSGFIRTLCITQTNLTFSDQILDSCVIVDHLISLLQKNIFYRILIDYSYLLLSNIHVNEEQVNDMIITGINYRNIVKQFTKFDVILSALFVNIYFFNSFCKFKMK